MKLTLEQIDYEISTIRKEISKLSTKIAALSCEKTNLYNETIVPSIKNDPIKFIFNSKAQELSGIGYKEINKLKHNYIEQFVPVNEKDHISIDSHGIFEDSGLSVFDITIYSDSSDIELDNITKFFNHMIKLGYDVLPKEDYIQINCTSNDLSESGCLPLRIDKLTHICDFGCTIWSHFTKIKSDSLLNILKYIRLNYWYGEPYDNVED